MCVRGEVTVLTMHNVTQVGRGLAAGWDWGDVWSPVSLS